MRVCVVIYFFVTASMTALLESGVRSRPNPIGVRSGYLNTALESQH